MACPRCGSGAPPLHGRCKQCGASLADDSALTAIGLATPIPLPNSDDSATQFGPMSGTAIPPPPPSGEMPVVVPAPAQQSVGLTVGQNFGSRYHIIRVLGVGGMGAVYQAWDQTLEVAVALKVVRPESAPDPVAAEALQRRFKQELLLARQVTHKNVVRIHDLGEIDGITYISMPYVQGTDLATVLTRDGRLPVERAVAIAKELAAGLVAAHAAGVVHRDLKPANIMIDADGGVLIMDFGIARSTSGSTAFGMTASGVIVGTVEYMAPEQAKGERVDARADIYSFGLILNDILLGRRQSTNTGVAELMARMTQPLASLRSIDATIPEWLDGVVNKCIQPDPAERYQSMTEVLEDLEAKSRDDSGRRAAGRYQPAGRVARLPARSWLPLAAARLLVGAAGGPAGRCAIASVAPRPPARRQTGGRGPSDVAGDSAVSQRLWRRDARLARVEPQRGAANRARAVRARPDGAVRSAAAGPAGPAHRAERHAGAGRAGARRGLHERAERAVGPAPRFGNAIRIDATLQDLDRQRERAAQRDGAERGRPVDRDRPSSPTRVRENLARGSPDILNELKSTSWKPSTSSFEALRLYNEGLAADARGQASGGAEELRGGHEGGR